MKQKHNNLRREGIRLKLRKKRIQRTENSAAEVKSSFVIKNRTDLMQKIQSVVDVTKLRVCMESTARRSEDENKEKMGYGLQRRVRVKNDKPE